MSVLIMLYYYIYIYIYIYDTYENSGNSGENSGVLMILRN